ncbi:NADP-dependent oxidoreductase domain-containing protein [Mrakia frigida]|uniref:NADP-dependent oxidoreductase domain-containing protein n=1 Tax=Mrakia frigida TaxID=29902 RepID=UPI003FCBF137
MSNRIITGLWQLAGGHDEKVDVESCSRVMEELVQKGLAMTFDMADHYGPAEQVVGHYRSRVSAYTLPQPQPTFFTKWCPQPEVSTAEETEAAVDLARSRMGVETVDRLQVHIWDYTEPTYLSLFCHLQSLQSSSNPKVKQLALTNTDTAHLLLLIHSGFTIASNQVSVSILDRRILNPNGMAAICSSKGVEILAYGVLLGGFLNEKWLGVEEPRGSELGNWSLKKYKRFIDVAGGWIPFQRVLSTLDFIAKKYTSPSSPITISTIAISYVLSLPAVASVIIGSRLSTSSVANAESNRRALDIELDEEDLQMIGQAQKELKDVPGDSGDEYRRAPFLTAKGDLSDHLDREGEEGTRRRLVEEAVARGERVEVSSGSPYEALAGYCRAVRLDSTIHISGTTATSPLPTLLPIAGGSSAASQLTHIFDIVTRALNKLNGSLSDVVRTRLFLSDLEADVEEVSREHGRAFAREGVRPSNTLVGAKLVGEFKVEMEVEARIGGKGVVLRV